MKDDFAFAGGPEINKRRQQVDELLRTMLDAEEQPYFISDETTLYDVSSDEEAELINRCIEHYGVLLEPHHLSLPLWKLIDHLESRRTTSQ
jgi:hypothetical protein